MEEIHINSDKKYSNVYLIFSFFLGIAYSSILIEPVLIPRQFVLSFFILTLLFLYLKDSTVKWIDFIQFGNKKFLFSILLLFISILLSSFFAYEKSLAIYVSSKYSIEFLFLIFISHLLIIRKISIQTLCYGVVIFSSIQLLSVLFQSLDIIALDHTLIDNKNLVGLTANKNLLSSCLYLSIPFIIYLLILTKNNILKVLFVLILIASSMYIYIIQSKTVYVGFIVFILCSSFLFFILFMKKWTKKRKITFILVSFFIISSSITFLAFKEKSKIIHFYRQNIVVKDNVTIDNHNDNTTLLVRFTLWKNSWSIIKESPLLGKGPGNWILFFPKYGLNQMKDLGVEKGAVVFQNPHNDWILLASEMGLLGLLFYIVFYILGIYMCIKNILNPFDNNIRAVNILILSSFLGLFFIHSSDFPLERIEHQVLIYLMYAIVLYSYSLARPVNNILTKKWGTSIFLFFFLISIYSILVTYNRWDSEKKMKELKATFDSKNWNLVLQKSNDLNNVFYKMDPTTMPIDWYRGVAYFNLNQFENANYYFNKAYKINPYNVNVLSNYAACYTKLNQFDKAISLYNKAISISPRYEELILNLTVVYFKQKNYKAALTTLFKCSLNPNNLDNKLKTYIHEITKAYLGEPELSTDTLEKQFFSLKNMYLNKIKIG
jgi:O-antigen ligase